jgi:hypothetical protein
MMNDRHEAGRLPRAQAYWDELAARSIDAAFRSSEAAAHNPARTDRAESPWWTGMAHAAPALAAVAAVALLGGIVLVGEAPPSAPAEPDAIMSALSPSEPMLRSLLLTTDAPPPAAALVSLVALRHRDR